MKVSLEFLYHFRCDRCDQWWSVADIEPKIGSQMNCPHCGYLNSVESIQTFLEAAKSSCLDKLPDKLPNKLPHQN